MTVFYIIITAVVAYFIGNFNFSIIISQGMGDDVRDHGSHNAGLTNMLRVYGKKLAVFTLLGDAGKGVLAALLAKTVTDAYGDEAYTVVAVFASSLMVMLGHIYPVFFNFRGGKGVLTTAACLAVADIRVFLCAVGVFTLAVIVTRYVSLGSVLGAVTAAVTVPVFCRGDKFIIIDTVIMLIMSSVIIINHKSNIKRLFSGTENKLKL